MKNNAHKQQTLIQRYISAKDNNKPHLMSLAFSPSATLTMEVMTDTITFPPLISGRDNITDTLVSNFNNRFDNVYTFCFSESWKHEAQACDCQWLVAMTSREDHKMRIGWGDYAWKFNQEDNCLINSLAITIKDMKVLTGTETSLVLNALPSLPYPYCHSSIIVDMLAMIDSVNLTLEDL